MTTSTTNGSNIIPVLFGERPPVVDPCPTRPSIHDMWLILDVALDVIETCSVEEHIALRNVARWIDEAYPRAGLTERVDMIEPLPPDGPDAAF